MYIRCADCLASTWVDVVGPAGLAKSAGCGGCGREYVLDPIEEIGTAVRDHYRRVLSFARERDFEMPSAYSVLLGIMSPAQAEVLRHSLVSERRDAKPEAGNGESAPEPATPRAKSDGLPLVPDFDLGFSKAIAAGRMTVQEAMTRGDRSAYARRLMLRRRLPEDLAYRVADNCIELRAALAESDRRKRLARPARGRRRARAATPKRNQSRWGALLAAGVGTLLVALVIRTIWQEKLVVRREPIRPARASATSVPTPEASTPASARAAEGVLPKATAVTKNEAGHVVQVVGPDAASVLAAFCAASPSPLGLKPLEVASTVPPLPGARLGLFRDPAALVSTWAIRVQRDARSGRWVAGHGRGAVPVVKAPGPGPATTVAAAEHWP